MHRLYTLLLVALTAVIAHTPPSGRASAAGSATDPVAGSFSRVSGTPALNLRTGPGYGYAIIRTMDRGEIVRVLSGPYDGGWYRVRYSGIVGYSIRTYLIHTGLAGARTARGYSRVVVISLARQQLEAYEHGKVWLVTPVTTGRPELPTPAGSSRAGAKLSPYTFVSPWPEGSPFYYEPSRVRYALRFRAGGYYIHDAPWRRFFGFGTDKVHSTASGVRTGSHGCVNVPPGAMRLLFDRVTVDTAIVVVRR